MVLVIYIIFLFMSLRVYIGSVKSLFEGDGTNLIWHWFNLFITSITFWNLGKIAEPQVPLVFLFIFAVTMVSIWVKSRNA